MKTTCYSGKPLKGERTGFVYKKEHQSSEFPGWVLQCHAQEPGESEPPASTHNLWRILHIPGHHVDFTQLPGPTCTCVWERLSVHGAAGTEQRASLFKRHFLTVTRCRDSSLGFPFDLTVNDSHLPPGTKQRADNVQRRRSPESHAGPDPPSSRVLTRYVQYRLTPAEYSVHQMRPFPDVR